MVHIHRFHADTVFILLLFFDQKVDAVKSYPTIVANNTSSSIGVRQPGDQPTVSCRFCFLIIYTEHTVIVGRPVLKFILYLPRQFIAICPAGFSCHAKSAEGIDAPLQRTVRLEPHDDLLLLIKIPRLIVQKRRYRLGIDVQHTAEFLLKRQQVLQLMEQPLRPLSRRFQK